MKGNKSRGARLVLAGVCAAAIFLAGTWVGGRAVCSALQSEPADLGSGVIASASGPAYIITRDK